MYTIKVGLLNGEITKDDFTKEKTFEEAKSKAEIISSQISIERSEWVFVFDNNNNCVLKVSAKNKPKDFINSRKAPLIL
jgi:hypothetical protein